MRLSLAVAASVATLLSACGGGSSDGTVTTPGGTPGDIEGVSGTGPAKVILVGDNQATRLDYDGTNRQMIVESIPFDDEVFESRLDRNRARDQDGYQAYSSVRGFDDYTAYRRDSSTGNVNVAVVNSGEYFDHGYSGAAYERVGDTNLPTETQRAYYNGKYIGTRTLNTQGGMDVIIGEANMEVDFSDDTYRGWVTNRVVVQNETGGSSGGDIVLKNSIINRDNATFAGEATQRDAGLDGTYAGVFGGANAEEVGGHILLEDNITRELGVFTAER